MQRQFTATVYIFKDNKTVLMLHKKFKKWLPPGGHVDPNETPQEAAKREAFEETGLEIELVSEENLWIDFSHSKSIERPHFCFLQEIPAYGTVEAHQHIDFVYLGRPVGGAILLNKQESEDLRWFTLEEIQGLEEGEIFPEVKLALERLFKTSESMVVV